MCGLALKAAEREKWQILAVPVY